ncbi:GMC oxidoreductase [Thalassotalea agariperforans]
MTNNTKLQDELYDVIVVGSGITGGWAAKEFCEKGFKTLVIERGRHLDHPSKEYTDMQAPWQLKNRGLASEIYDEQGRYQMLKKKKGRLKTDSIQFFVDEKEHPYSYPEERPFMWTRGYQLGGRSLTWGRQVLRWGPKDFQSNEKDGHGVPWPIGYEDLAPWYDYVERFIGVAGNNDGIADLPDGVFQKPWQMSCAEQFIADNMAKKFNDRRLIIGRSANLTEPTEEQAKQGRGQCQARSYCARGCSFGAYFSSLSATLPVARNTGNLTIITDAIASTVDYDEATGKASGVTIIDANTKEKRRYNARVVFLCASALGSVQILLNSTSKTFPNGIANSSGVVGHYIMDHFTGAVGKAEVPGLEDKYSYGRRPIGTYIPSYRHYQQEDLGFTRGFGFQAFAGRGKTGTSAKTMGIGAEVKAKANQDKPWHFTAAMYGEMLPYYENAASLHPTKKDKWGMPQLHIDAEFKDNERKMSAQAAIDIKEILEAGGCTNIKIIKALDNNHRQMVGARTHEMGGACMGKDPKTSVLNKWAQTHDVKNLFVTDGAAMSSCATQNPSLTYMAITARAADYAVKLMNEGKL